MSVRVFAAAALLACVSCSPETEGPTLLSVYAASSLTEAFGALETAFEEAHPQADVAITFAGSQILRIQIEEGAPADVYASANPDHMRGLLEAGLASGAHVFAHNELVVVVPRDDSTAIDSFSDLPTVSRLVLGTQNVPVGRYARDVLTAADSFIAPGFSAAVGAKIVSEEPNARLARAKVELGEADAAIVYLTDALSSDRVRPVPIPPRVNVRAEYLVATVAREGRSPLAEAWIGLVMSDEGRAVLARYGFVVE